MLPEEIKANILRVIIDFREAIFKIHILKMPIAWAQNMIIIADICA